MSLRCGAWAGRGGAGRRSEGVRVASVSWGRRGGEGDEGVVSLVRQEDGKTSEG